MTGSGEFDDVDDVTLWAGRLRPWPSAAVPAEDDPDDVTVRSEPRSSDRDDPVDATERSSRPVSAAAVDDATVPVRAAVDEQTVARAPRPVIEGDDLDDTTTGARAVRPPVEADDLDDTTTGARAPRPVVEDDDLDDTTTGARAVRPPVEDDDLDDTAVGARRTNEPEHDATERRERRGDRPSADRPAAVASDPAPGTRAALRRGEPDPVFDDLARRSAHAPDPVARETYGRREDLAVRVERTAVPARPAGAGDAAAVRSRSGRRSAAVLLLVGTAALVVVVAGAIVVALLAF